VVAAVTLTVCSVLSGPATAATGPVPSTAPGVSAHAIDVGSLTTASGALAGQFGQVVYGVRAYFDAVDAKGGVDGRKIYLKY
jgi:branched-chain amino acid transport system substrate-binding protein